jgi:hypothetical protein
VWLPYGMPVFLRIFMQPRVMPRQVVGRASGFGGAPLREWADCSNLEAGESDGVGGWLRRPKP